MAFTAGFSVNVGDPTKASDVDVLAANDDYLKNAIDTFIANDANNRVLTATGSGTANAESNLTFDGSTLTVTGTVSATTFSGNVTGGTISGSTGAFSSTLAATGATTIGAGQVVNAKALLTLTSTTSAGYGGEIQFHKNSASTAEIGHESAVLGSGLSSDLFLASDGAIDFATGGTTQRMTILSDGKTGIGTASPTTKLHVSGASSASALRLDETTSSANSYLGYIDTSGNFGIDVNGGGYLRFAVGGAERARITNTGNVGIGTASPNAPLAVASKASSYEGMELVTPSGDGSGVFQFGVHQSGTTFGRGIEFRRGGSDGFDTLSMAIDASGNMGLGVAPSTWSGRTALEIEGASTGYVTSPNGPIAIGSNIYYNGGDKFVGNGYAPLYALSSGNHIWYTSNNNTSGAGAAVTLTQAMTLTNAGLLGIGTSSPTFLIDAKQATSGSTATLARFTNTSNTADSHVRLMVTNGGTSGGDAFIQYAVGFPNYTTGIDATDGSFKIQYGSGVDPIFGSVGSTRLTIDSSGNVGIGTSSPSGRLHVEGGGIYHIGSSLKYIASSSVQSISSTNNAGAELTTDAYLWINRSSAPCVFLNRTTTTGQIAVFYSDLTAVGSISVTASATAYNTSSDYRLKENLAPITGAVDRVNALQPRRFNFISDPDTTVDGFLAHEVSDIVPEAITGEKDAVDADGNPEYQGIDQSKLVPLLTAAIQELTARIEALEAA